MSLLGCSVVYKEKQLKRKEHKLKIVPVGAEAIVLALQSREQTEQWLRVRPSRKPAGLEVAEASLAGGVERFFLSHLRQVIQEISPKPAESCDPHLSVFDSPRLICTKVELIQGRSQLLLGESAPPSLPPSSPLTFCCCQLPGRAEREAVSGVGERQQHRQPCRVFGKQRR